MRALCYAGHMMTSFAKWLARTQGIARMKSAKHKLLSYPLEDEASSKQLERAFRKRGIAFKTGVRFSGVAPTATGVAVSLENGETKIARCKGEVILSAGAFQSPVLLMLSGIGPAGHLQAHGIPQGVVSSSKNAEEVLESADTEEEVLATLGRARRDGSGNDRDRERQERAGKNPGGHALRPEG